MTSSTPARGSAVASRAADGARASRKIVTVLFMDVIDSTVLADSLDPESYRALMARYFSEANELITHHGGFVEKFIGDAVMAVFGVPRLHEDDTLRAVTAAVGVRDRLVALKEEFERTWGASISVRVGVETGEAMALLQDPMELYVTGPVVNTAARLEQDAGPNEILMGDAAYQFVRDAVVVEDAGELNLKGKQERVRAWHVIDVIRGAAGRARRLDAPMIDREQELSRLMSSFERAATNGGQIVTLIGPAGIGKSRLANEFASRLDQATTVLRGRCLPYGDGITFWPVVEVLRDLARIADTDTPEDSASKLHDLLGAGADSDLIVARLASLLGSGESQPAIQEMFWAFRKLLEQVAADRPVVLVFDDIERAEPTFLDLLEYLADWSRRAPILLLCLARAEFLEARPGWGSAKPNAELIWLQPLTADQTRALVEQLIGGGQVKADAVSRIANVAEGNALFVEETVRMLVDTEQLHPVDGQWTLKSAASELRLPSTIHALVSARLDRLAGAEMEVLERAAVVGRTFGWSAVSALADDDTRDGIGAHLQSLMRKQLIRPRYGESDEEDSFEFVHSLVRDAAYQQIAKTERVNMHERVAQWVADERGNRAGEYEEIVGYHLEQAHAVLRELGPRSERSDQLARRAFAALSEAGERAFARGDMPAAVSLLSRATAVLEPGDADRVRLLPSLAFALMETGDFERLQAVVAEAGEAAEAGDPASRAHTTILHLWIRLFTDPVGWADVAQQEATRTVSEFEQLGDEQGQARASSLLGLVNMMKGRFGEAETAWEQASSHAGQAGNQRDELESMSWVPLTIWAGSTPTDEAIRRCQELLARVDGDKKAMSSALMSLGALQAGTGRIEESRESMRRARELLDEVALTVWRAGPYTQLIGWVELLARDTGAAERELRAGFDTLSEIGEMSWFSTVAAMLGEAVLANGRADEARTLADASHDAAAPDDVYSQVLWRTVASKVLAGDGSHEEAERLAREAVDLLSPTDFLHLRWHAHLSRAQVLETLGRGADAAVEATQAADIAARKGAILAEQQARETAQRLAKTPSPT